MVLAAATVLALGNLGVQTIALQILVAAAAGSIGVTFSLVTALGGREVAANIATGRALRPEQPIGGHLKVDQFEGKIVAVRSAVVIVENERGRVIVPLALLLQQPFEVR